MKASVDKAVISKIAHMLRGDEAAQVDLEFQGWLGGHIARAVVRGVVLTYQFEASQADFFTFSCSAGELRAAAESAGRAITIDRERSSIGGARVNARFPYPHFLRPSRDTAVWLDASALASAFARVRAAVPGADDFAAVRFVKSPEEGTVFGLWDEKRAAFMTKAAVWGCWRRRPATHTITLPLWVVERAVEAFNGAGVFQLSRAVDGPTEIAGGRFYAITR